MDKTILEPLRQELLTRTPLDTIPAGVWKRAGALNPWGTNGIERNPLARREVERVLLEQRSVADRPLQDVLETVQHARAFEELLSRKGKPIRLPTILELHEAVFHVINDDAGLWRRVNVRIAGTRHVPPRMEQVVPMMSDWIESYAKKDMLGEDGFALAAEMHFGFESIHPFSDGNGRVGRLLLNLHFLKHNWPPVHILPPDRDRYLTSLEKGHAGTFADLVEFLGLVMGRSLLDLLDQVGTREDELRPLKKLAGKSPYSAKYLGLRASQDRLPAFKVSGDWRTSERAIRVYRAFVAR